MEDTSSDTQLAEPPLPPPHPTHSTISQSITLTQTSATNTIASTTSTTTVKFTRRAVSGASIADPTQDSAGGSRVWASNEKASDIFANNLIRHIISFIWPDGITLDWVQGRNGDTKLVWSSKYIPLFPFFFTLDDFR